jgi:hypothetical protein
MLNTVVNFEFLYFNKLNFFFKLGVYDPLTGKEYSKIYNTKINTLLPEISNVLLNVCNTEEEHIIPKLLSEKFDLLKRNKCLFKQILSNHVLMFLKDEKTFSLFESGDDFILKINSCLA